MDYEVMFIVPGSLPDRHATARYTVTDAFMPVQVLGSLQHRFSATLANSGPNDVILSSDKGNSANGFILGMGETLQLMSASALYAWVATGESATVSVLQTWWDNVTDRYSRILFPITQVVDTALPETEGEFSEGPNVGLVEPEQSSTDAQ